MSKIAEEVVERMEALVRRIGAASPESPLGSSDFGKEARDIVALLPEQVDPDLIEAREMYIAIEWAPYTDPAFVRDVRQGADDESDEVRLLLKGLKRGRQLERLSRATQKSEGGE